MILRKISKYDATRCQISRPTCTKFDFRWGSAADIDGGPHSALPNLLAVFKGPTSKGEGREEGKGRERVGNRRAKERGEEREGEGPAPKYFGLEAPARERVDHLLLFKGSLFPMFMAT